MIIKRQAFLLKLSFAIICLVFLIYYFNKNTSVDVLEDFSFFKLKAPNDNHNKVHKRKFVDNIEINVNDRDSDSSSRDMIKQSLKESFKNSDDTINENKKKCSKEETNEGKNFKMSEYNYLQRYPFFRECNHKNYNNDQTKDNNVPYDYSQVSLKSTHDLRILRAIILYFPIEKSDEFKDEFRWLYRSWIEVQKHEPILWRTDLIVFTENIKEKFENPDFVFNQLNCSFKHKRTLREQLPMCTLIQFEAIRNRKLDKLPLNFGGLNTTEQHKYLLSSLDIYSNNSLDMGPFYYFLKQGLSTYHYADSILMAFDGYEYFKNAGFDFLIRSDMDVFITPLFAQWLPRYCNDFFVGGGGYSNDFNNRRLMRIASNIKWKHASVKNLGSTWYSTPHQFRLVSYLTLFSMAYLGTEEFSQPEREGKVGTILWPEWHYGVLLLYGQNLALNHLIATNQTNVVRIESYLDYPSANTLSVYKVLHIHVFHGDELFSKFMFKMGRYDNMSLPSNENATLIKYYALKMALEGKRTSGNELVKQFNKEVLKKI